MDYILASASPRRQELLRQINMPFRVVISDVEENIDYSLSPAEIVKSLALQKGQAVFEKLKAENNLKQSSAIISADTVVVYNNTILGKPKDKAEAFDMLSMLSGKEHYVYTGVAIIKYNNGEVSIDNFADYAKVYFRTLEKAEIVNYIETGEPMDKAGAYGIQERGAVLIDKIEGDFYTIVGLPLVKVYKSLMLTL